MEKNSQKRLSHWVFVLAQKDLAALASLRAWPNLWAASREEEIYLRLPHESNQLDMAFFSLPFRFRYVMDAQNRLYVPGKRIPVQELPALEWQLIHEFLPLSLPTAAMPAHPKGQYKLTLQRSEHVRESAALRCDWDLWETYAETASQIRLHAVQFAVSQTREVLIVGKTLPPIPGKTYWLSGSLLIPAGFDFSAPIMTPLIEKRLNPEKDGLVLIEENGQWQKITATDFVNGSRSAVRKTAEAQSNG